IKEFKGYLELLPDNPTLFQQYFPEYAVPVGDSAQQIYENPLAHLGLPQSACESSSMESANTGSRFWYAIFDDPISRDNGTSNEEWGRQRRSEEHTSELQSRSDLVCRLLLEKKKK